MNSMVNGVHQSAETLTTSNGAITADNNAPSHNANETGPRVLNSWKDIANYLGKGVRTVQRYESQFGLPIRRPAGKNRSSVIALADEIDAWLNHAPTRNACGTRVLLVLAQNHSEKDSQERMLLEVSAGSFHRARTVEEICALASHFDGDAVVVECNPGDQIRTAILDSMKQRHPATVIFVSPEVELNHKTPKSDEPKLENVDAGKFLHSAKKAFRHAKAA